MPTRRPRQKARDSHPGGHEQEEEEQMPQDGVSPTRDAPSSWGGSSGKRRERETLSELVSSRVGPVLGREPRTDSEKREVYLTLVRLKAQRKTHEECASLMGVSRSTIANYVADPLFKEMQAELVSEARERGHVLIGETIDSALETLVGLMGAQSEFVRFKAAEALLNYAGYNLPREERRTDSREGLSRFMELLAERDRGRGPSTVVNVEVHDGGRMDSEGKAQTLVEGHLVEEGAQETSNSSTLFSSAVKEHGTPPTSAAVPSDARAALPPELARYTMPVLPGGKLPFSSRGKQDDDEELP